MSKILIFRDDDSANAGSILPNRLVFRAAKPNIGDMFGLRVLRAQGSAQALSAIVRRRGNASSYVQDRVITLTRRIFENGGNVGVLKIRIVLEYLVT